MTQRLLRSAAPAGLFLLLFVGVLLAVLPSRGSESAKSALSTKDDGLRAAYLVLEGLGFPVEVWDDAPGRLGGPRELLLLSEVPDAPPRGPEVEPPDEAQEGAEAQAERARLAARSRDLGHYRRFVEQGGTLLAFASGKNDDEWLEFLGESLGVEEFGELAFRASSDGPLRDPSMRLPQDEIDRRAQEVWLGQDERIETGRALELEIEVPEEGFEVLASAGNGAALAVAHSVGSGRVVLTSLSLEGFDNHALRNDSDGAYLLVRFLQELGSFERVLFDEYALGHFGPPSATTFAFSPLAALLSAHLLALFALLTWKSAWVGPFPRDPEPLAAAAALARARGFGRTLAAGKRWELLARLLRHGTLERWSARAGLRSIRKAGGLEGAEVEALLGALARGDRRILAALRAAFLERAVSGEEDLEALDRELAALERALFERKTTRD